MYRLLSRLFTTLILFAALPLSATPLENRPDLERHFTAAGVKGTFVLFDVTADRLIAYNTDRANRRFVPASTFKILNSLIAFETGAVKDTSEIISYGGKPQRIKAWEKDMNLRDAMQISNVPVYQEVARRIGLERMQRHVDLAGYGNRTIGKVVDRFWLDGPLEISAREQAQFVARLAQRQLPFNTRSMDLVSDLIRQESGAGYTLYAKTGWDNKSQPALGWWVGWVEKAGRIYAFALNIDIVDDKDAAKRLPVARACLQDLGVLPD